MKSEPTYPDAPRPDTFESGVEFQDFVCCELAKRGIILQNLGSRRYQLAVGENVQGFEIKLDERHTGTGRLAIEVAEKSHRSVGVWTPSGIWRCDNSWLYIQGNRDLLFIFSVSFLRNYEQWKKPEVVPFNGTIRRWFLPHDVARKWAAKVIDFNDTQMDMFGGTDALGTA